MVTRGLKREIGFYRRGSEVLYFIGCEPFWEMFENPGWNIRYRGFPMPPGLRVEIVFGDFDQQAVMVKAFGRRRSFVGRFLLMRTKKHSVAVLTEPRTLEEHQAWYLWQSLTPVNERLQD